MDQDVLKIAVDDLKNRRVELREQQKKTEEAIKELQEVCDHVFEFQGHELHYDWEKCIYCGKEQKV